MIEQIELINWRSHADSKLHFHAGTNLLVGSMGAGKSSVLDAIVFALFGTFPALERRKLKMENLIRARSDTAQVRLRFHWGGDAYLIERTITQDKRGVSGQASIYQGDRMLDHGPVAVNTYLEHLLGVDYDLFTRAIYSEQNNVDYFLTLDPRRRKQEIDALLGLDRFEIVRANVVSLLHQLHTQRKTLEEKLDRPRLEETRQKKVRLEADHRICQEKKILLEKALQENERVRIASEKEFLHLRKRKEEYDQVRQEHIRLEARMEQLRQEWKEVDEKAYAELRLETAHLEEVRQQLAIQRNEHEGRAQTETQQLVRTEAQLADLEKKCAAHRTHLEQWNRQSSGKTAVEFRLQVQNEEEERLQLEVRHKSLEEEKQRLLETRGRLAVGMDRCPLCEQPLSEGAILHVQRERDFRLQQLVGELAALSLRFPALRDRSEKTHRLLRYLEALEQELQEAVGWEHELPLLREKKSSLEKSQIALSTARKALDEKAELVRREWERIALQLKEMERQRMRKQELEKNTHQLEQQKARLEALRINEEDFERARGRMEEQRIAYERNLGELRTAEQQAHSLGDLLRLMSDEIQRQESLEKEILSLGQWDEQLTRYRNAVLETQMLLRSSLLGSINAALNEIWKIFYPYGNYSELRLRVDEKDYLFEVLETDWKPLESVASGGERSCAALTLRVALAMVLAPNLSWLILDEPTHNLDKQAVELLSQTLQFKVPEVVKQSFVITHEEALMGSDFASSYKLSRDKANGGATVVERI